MKNEFNQLVKDLVDPYLETNAGWLQTDAVTEEIVGSSDFNNLIKDPNSLIKIFKQAVSARVRQTIRGKKDENGLPLFANLSYEDEKGNSVHLYKHKDNIDAEDALKLRSYWIAKTVEAKNQAVLWNRTYSELTGKQALLPFDADSFIDD